MSDKRDVDILEEYEELIVLMRQLHDDVPILEKQHKSIRNAFVSAQAKMEKTIDSAGDEIRHHKGEILAEFEAECKDTAESFLSDFQVRVKNLLQTMLAEFEEQCRIVSDEVLDDAEVRAEELLEEVQKTERSVHTLLSATTSAAQRVPASVEVPKKRTDKPVKAEPLLEDGYRCTGVELYQKFASHFNKDLFVKRIGRKNGRAWNNDFCMFVIEVSDGKLYGDRYKDGDLYDEQVGYELEDLFEIYSSPSEKMILKSRGK